MRDFKCTSYNLPIYICNYYHTCYPWLLLIYFNISNQFINTSMQQSYRGFFHTSLNPVLLKPAMLIIKRLVWQHWYNASHCVLSLSVLCPGLGLFLAYVSYSDHWSHSEFELNQCCTNFLFKRMHIVYVSVPVLCYKRSKKIKIPFNVYTIFDNME